MSDTPLSSGSDRNDIEQWAMDETREALYGGDENIRMSHRIALALQSAYFRGRAEGMEEAARICDQNVADLREITAKLKKRGDDEGADETFIARSEALALAQMIRAAARAPKEEK